MSNFFTCAISGDRQYDPHLHHLKDQRCAAIAEERQRNSRVGHGVCDHCHIEDHLNSHLEGETVNQQRAEKIGCVTGNVKASPNEHHKQSDHKEGAKEAQLLANNGEDKVVLRL